MIIDYFVNPYTDKTIFVIDPTKPPVGSQCIPDFDLCQEKIDWLDEFLDKLNVEIIYSVTPYEWLPIDATGSE